MKLNRGSSCGETGRATLVSMACEVCDRLTTEVMIREQTYVASRGRMASAAEDPESAGYRRLKLDCDDARIDLQLARLELEKHKNQHARAT